MLSYTVTPVLHFLSTGRNSGPRTSSALSTTSCRISCSRSSRIQPSRGESQTRKPHRRRPRSHATYSSTATTKHPSRSLGRVPQEDVPRGSLIGGNDFLKANLGDIYRHSLMYLIIIPPLNKPSPPPRTLLRDPQTPSKLTREASRPSSRDPPGRRPTAAAQEGPVRGVFQYSRASFERVRGSRRGVRG